MNSVIKHIVAWRLKDFAEGKSKQDNCIEMKEQLEKLNGKFSGMLKLEVGIDFSKSNYSSDIVLYSEFDSKESLVSYQKNQAHIEIKKFIEKISFERRIIDYEIVTNK